MKTYKTPRIILDVGDIFIITSMVTGITLFLYFLFIKRLFRSLLLITDDFRLFAKNSVPYIINYLLYWYLSLVFEKLILSNYLVTKITTKHYLISKVILGAFAIVTKYSLSNVESTCFRIVLFISHLIVTATSEAMSYKKYEPTAINVALILLFWMTVLILVSCSKTKTTHFNKL